MNHRCPMKVRGKIQCLEYAGKFKDCSFTKNLFKVRIKKLKSEEFIITAIQT